VHGIIRQTNFKRKITMPTKHLWFVCAFAAAGMAQAPAQTATESAIYSFFTFPYGANPYAPLARDSADNLYGTTNQGGQADVGLVFKLSSSGKETTLHSFLGGNDGANPYSGVLLADGNLYGTTYQGGASNAGIVYEISPSGTERVLYSFTGGADGGNPYAGVIADSAGNLYGTTYKGGAFGYGTVYKLTPAGQETVLYSFSGGADGANPYAGVIWDPSGNLYGTALYGGVTTCTYGCGVVYKLSPTGQQTVLYSFSSQNHGAGWPYAGVIRDSAGNLYGTASGGGEKNGGEVYEISAAGTYSVLYSFFINGGPAVPKGGLVRDSSGNLYGTTEQYNLTGLGAVYKLEAGGHIKLLYTFPGSGDNTNMGSMNAGVILDSQGNLYGTTPYGGTQGMAYKLSSSGAETTLYNFTPAPGGTIAFAGVTRDAAGNLYGATQKGGASNAGVVYRVNTAGQEKALYNFTNGVDGGSPEWTPVVDTQGNVYGTTLGGGSAPGAAGFGVVYKIDLSGQESVLHTFTGGADGGYPNFLTIDAAGNLYGTAWYGANGGGVLYEIDASGQQSILYSFTGGADGGNPGSPILGSAGNIYGVTAGGGAYGLGVIFKVDPSGQETVLYSFPGGPEGAGPEGIVMDSAGNLYGATAAGGGAVDEAGSGVVFELTAGGAYNVLYVFTGGADGGMPFAGVIRDSVGNLYGTTNGGGITTCTAGGGLGCGVVYKVDPAGQETVLHAFTGGADGNSPNSGLVADSSGNLYGTTPWGGKGGFSNVFASGGGVVFKVAP
jgi:uncharacterized repeat protein (TIGR03803 family)